MPLSLLIYTHTDSLTRTHKSANALLYRGAHDNGSWMKVLVCVIKIIVFQTITLKNYGLTRIRRHSTNNAQLLAGARDVWGTRKLWRKVAWAPRSSAGIWSFVVGRSPNRSQSANRLKHYKFDDKNIFWRLLISAFSFISPYLERRRILVRIRWRMLSSHAFPSGRCLWLEYEHVSQSDLRFQWWKKKLWTCCKTDL